MSESVCCSILDIPDEILVKIILYFNVRKRLALAYSCTRFNDLVFGDKELLRELDFSRKGRLITLSDIQQYFSDEEACTLVMKVNIQNVLCMKSGDMLNGLIGKATNLVDINVHGVKFKDIEQLGSFLEPLVHVKRLSVDWPESDKDDVAICRKFLEKPLSRFTYLSVEVCVYSKVFLPTVQLCEELEELRIYATAPEDRHARVMPWKLELNKPRNLKIVQVSGWQVYGSLKDHLVAMVPDRKKWTDFQIIDVFREGGFYLEKNVQVCEELKKTKLMKSIPYFYLHEPFEFGWFLISECLLDQVIRITHEDVPEKFCCLTIPQPPPVANINEEPCHLKIDEAKQLLKDPGYQITFLHFKHSIEPNCDAHLVASAFPNITELVLSHIIKGKDGVSTPEKKNHLQRRLKKRGSTAHEEPVDGTNQDSSFKILIENTPHVRDLTIYARNICDTGFGSWDLDALYLIPLWKNLRILRLAFIPVKDGKFLIHIGKECPRLEKIVLSNLGFSNPCCYTSDLSQMLSHCRNLKEFSINQGRITEVPEIFVSLSNNLNLRTVRVINATETYNSLNLVSSIEQLLYRCPKLTTFVFVMTWISQEDTDELTTAMRRIKGELNRPHFQFQTTKPRYTQNGIEQPTDIVYEDASLSFFPRKLDGFELE